MLLLNHCGKKISQALVELNVLQNHVVDLKTSPLAPEEEIYISVPKDWKLREEECVAQEEEVLKKPKASSAL